jgi:HSP20 family protein
MTQIVRFSPRSDLRRMQHEFDRLFGNFFPGVGLDSDDDQSASWAPRLDVVESADAFLFEFDVPGVEKDDIQIKLHDGVLTVSGEKTGRELREDDSVVRVERFVGRFFRSFSIPTAIEAGKIEATFNNGVLSVRLPKAEESKPRKIKIS